METSCFRVFMLLNYMKAYVSMYFLHLLLTFSSQNDVMENGPLAYHTHMSIILLCDSVLTGGELPTRILLLLDHRSWRDTRFQHQNTMVCAGFLRRPPSLQYTRRAIPVGSPLNQVCQGSPRYRSLPVCHSGLWEYAGCNCRCTTAHIT